MRRADLIYFEKERVLNPPPSPEKKNIKRKGG